MKKIYWTILFVTPLVMEAVVIAGLAFKNNNLKKLIKFYDKIIIINQKQNKKLLDIMVEWKKKLEDKKEENYDPSIMS